MQLQKYASWLHLGKECMNIAIQNRPHLGICQVWNSNLGLSFIQITAKKIVGLYGNDIDDDGEPHQLWNND